MVQAHEISFKVYVCIFAYKWTVLKELKAFASLKSLKKKSKQKNININNNNIIVLIYMLLYLLITLKLK